MTIFDEKYQLVGGELADQDLAQLLLTNRDVGDDDKAMFLQPKWDSHHDPMLMKGMAEAVERIATAVEKNQQVRIFSDYDADGVPGAVILHDFFFKIGFENFSVYIPNRNTEGFGLNTVCCQKFIEEKDDLVITIDCGTANVEQVKQLRDAAVDVIVTDHHLPDAAGLPDAILVNAKQPGCEYPFSELCGSGVIFKLVQALIASGKIECEIKEGWEKWLLDMVGVATICDMVPLVGENRLFAYYGLQVLQKSPRVGLQTMLKLARTEQRTIDAQDVAFGIGPRVNAAGRMGDPMLAFRALASTGQQGIDSAQELEKLNRKRKTTVASAVKEAYKKVEGMEEPAVIVVGKPDWPLGIVGLIAGKIADKYKKPAFVWGRVASTDGSEYKGSTRSGSDISIHSLMSESEEGTFVSFGGHEKAGGFVCDETQIHYLGERLNAAVEKAQRGSSNKVVVDAEITIDHVNKDSWDIIKRLEPYGMGNPCPKFFIKNVPIHAVRLFGADQNHMGLSFKNSRGWTINAIRFNFADLVDKAPESGQSVSLVVSFELNTYNGNSELRLRIEDLYL